MAMRLVEYYCGVHLAVFPASRLATSRGARRVHG
jgi:hypothetical protein